MNKLEKLQKDLKKLDKLKQDIESVTKDREEKLNKRIELLKLKNCLTCKKKKCLNRNKILPTSDCEEYYSKEYKYMIRKIKM